MRVPASSSDPLRHRYRLAGMPSGRLLLIVPILVFDVVLLVMPLGLMMLTSFDHGFQSYLRVLDNPLLRLTVTNTVVISIVTTLFAVALAYPCAAAAWKAGPVLRIVVFAFLLLPFWTGLLVKNFAWAVLLQDNGVINDFLQSINLAPEPLPLLHNRFAVIVGMVHYVLPYAFVPIYVAMRAIDPQLERAAASLGASKFWTTWRIILPLSLPGIYAASLLVLILSIGFFITPVLLGGPGDMMVSNLVDLYARQLVLFDSAAALALMIIVIVGVLVAFYQRLPKEGQYGTG